MWSLLPVKHMAARRLGRPARSMREVAARAWEIAPCERALSPRAHFLPEQLERVTGWAFADEHPGRAMHGGFEVEHAATRGLLLRDALLIDGVLYKDDACVHLQPRTTRLPGLHVEHEIERGALYCTAGGNQYFGQWLMDDCVTYSLACREGLPVTTDRPVDFHTTGFEDWLGMKPSRQHSAFFRELVVFEDFGQNRSKHARFRGMQEKLLNRVAPVSEHPGVFILRGRTGQRRVLRNELELAELLHDKRGFRILDPIQNDVPTLVRTCAGARAVVGVEGSGLMHGILLLGAGGAVLTLQPPNRFVGLYKHLTDRDRQHFGFVVGFSEGEDFRIDPVEVERTLDLFPT